MLMVVIASSCNKDDVITITLDNENYRAATPSSAEQWDKVWEYTPAPGQFINDTKTGGFTGEELSPEAAAGYAESRMSDGKFVSLGGFGGSITVAFVPGIENKADDYDFQILGNAFTGSAEPGIIRVSADTNNNGIADDDWFEIAGSEHISGNITPNYTVTYLRPETPTSPIEWSDNNGANGIMDRLDSFHPQPYYPQWIDANSITVSGTLIHHNLERYLLQ